MMKKGLCFECGKRGHRANQCKTKDETSAADGIQAVQINNQEHTCSWMNNRVHPRSTKWKGACAKECVGNSSQWITVTKETRWNDHGSHDLMTCPRIGTTLKAWLKDPSLPMCTIKNKLANKHS